MAETNKALRLKQGGNEESPSTHPASRSGILMLLFAGLIAGLSSQAQADPPTENRVLFNCTFTTDAMEGINLQDALDIPDLAMLNGDELHPDGQLKASYILIYVRQNPNNGQNITPLGTPTTSFTGPILCRNVDTDAIAKTTEGTSIPGPVDILGAEEVSHLQLQPSSSTEPNDRKKRVCHTVASNTDCFLIGPKP